MFTAFYWHVPTELSQVDVLKRSVLSPPSPLKPYSCSTCGKSYRQISLLNLHRKRHTGEARYSCKVCSKLFTTSGNLKRHQLVHSGEKPYHCDYCDKAFSDPTAKMRHLETHDTEKGNKCPHCDKRFNQVTTCFCCFLCKNSSCSIFVRYTWTSEAVLHHNAVTADSYSFNRVWSPHIQLILTGTIAEMIMGVFCILMAVYNES